MGNDYRHERFLRLLAKVLMMAVNGNRYIYYVYGVLSGERAAARPIGNISWEQRINERIGLILTESDTYLDAAIDTLQEILDGPKPVFVEFTVRIPSAEEMVYSTGYTGEKVYYVGPSLRDILQETNQGKNRGLYHFSHYRIISEEIVRSMRLEFAEDGVQSVKRGEWCFQIGNPEKDTPCVFAAYQPESIYLKPVSFGKTPNDALSKVRGSTRTLFVGHYIQPEDRAHPSRVTICRLPELRGGHFRNLKIGQVLRRNQSGYLDL